MLVAAESLAIGSCWIHAVNFLFTTDAGKSLRNELGIPEGYIAIGSAGFGYKVAESPTPAPRRAATVNIIK